MSPTLVKVSQYAAAALPDGLFSIKEPGNERRYRIVTRGYDKFFNIGELSWTTVRMVLLYAPEPFLTVLWPVVIS